MTAQAETLFTVDRQDRLLFINEPAEPKTYRAPRFFLGLTEAGSVYRFRDDVPSSICDRIRGLHLPETEELRKGSTYCRTITGVLEEASLVETIWCGPAYVFPEGVHKPSDVVELDEDDAHLLQEGFPEIAVELSVCLPCTAVVDEGKAVSVCRSVRKSAKAEEAGVETLPTYRGRGLIGLAVTAWATAVRSVEKIPFYSTSWENHASQRVAQKLGLVQFGVDLHFT